MALYVQTDTQFCSYVARLFSKIEVFQTKIVLKMKTHVLCPLPFSRKPCRLCINVDKYGRIRHAISDKITRRMRPACWVTKATDTHTRNI